MIALHSRKSKEQSIDQLRASSWRLFSWRKHKPKNKQQASSMHVYLRLSVPLWPINVYLCYASCIRSPLVLVNLPIHCQKLPVDVVHESFLPQCPWGLIERERGQSGHIYWNWNDSPRQRLSLKGSSDHHPRTQIKEENALRVMLQWSRCVNNIFVGLRFYLTHHVRARIVQVCLVLQRFHQQPYRGTDCRCPLHYQRSGQLCLLLPPHAVPFVQRSTPCSTHKVYFSSSIKEVKLLCYIDYLYIVRSGNTKVTYPLSTRITCPWMMPWFFISEQPSAGSAGTRNISS